MSGAILPLPQYAFMAWCSVKAQYCSLGCVTFESLCNLWVASPPLAHKRRLLFPRECNRIVSNTVLCAFSLCAHGLEVPYVPVKRMSRDNSVGIALGCGLDDRRSRVRFPAEAGDFSLHHRIQNGSGPHPASYLSGNRGSFPEDKAAGAWS
jgi:hypothetical protein